MTTDTKGCQINISKITKLTAKNLLYFTIRNHNAGGRPVAENIDDRKDKFWGKIFSFQLRNVSEYINQ